ncbi:MAG: hypothetical protein A2V85_14555 [Chloroflexi bacterium RBG_16_72_14]|nr:MAG: hypothetical protein A2V85_14555 [Chloroflexi bacterium RBG_16_72_14]
MKLPRTMPILIAAIALAVAACSSQTPAASGSSPATNEVGEVTQTSEGGQVTVEVDWVGPSEGASFHVKLDTHAIDLDPLDLADAILRNDRGETMTARPWAAPKGGHHREGFLSFEGDSSAFFADTDWIELVLAGVGDLPQRTLRWEVGA